MNLDLNLIVLLQGDGNCRCWWPWQRVPRRKGAAMRL